MFSSWRGADNKWREKEEKLPETRSGGDNKTGLRGHFTWNNFRGHDERDPGHDHEEAGGEVDLEQHRRPPPHHVNLQRKYGENAGKCCKIWSVRVVLKMFTFLGVWVDCSLYSNMSKFTIYTWSRMKLQSHQKTANIFFFVILLCTWKPVWL